MAYLSNNDKILQAVLLDEKLMEVGQYSPQEIGANIDAALDSDNCVINTVAQIIKETNDGATEREIWKVINDYLKRNI